MDPPWEEHGGRAWSDGNQGSADGRELVGWCPYASQLADREEIARHSVCEAFCSFVNEPLAEHDGELSLCFEPLLPRPFPLRDSMIEN